VKYWEKVIEGVASVIKIHMPFAELFGYNSSQKKKRVMLLLVVRNFNCYCSSSFWWEEICFR